MGNEPLVVTSTEGSKNKISKIVFATFVLVLIVVVAEGIYYYSTKDDRQAKKEAPSIEDVQERPITISEEKEDISSKKINQESVDELFNFIQGASRHEGFVYTADANVTILGTVENVGLNQKVPGVNTTLYPLFIKISNQDGQTITMRFTQEEVDVTKVYLPSDDEKTESSINNISNGDKIVLRLTKNLFSEPGGDYEISIDVFKLNQ